MPSVIYKTLFEVKILHEYFLTRPDGSSLFDKTSVQKALFLEEEFSANNLSVNEFLGFEFPTFAKQAMEASYLRVVPSYSGFKVAVKVIPQPQSSGELLFKPTVPLAANQDIFIQINRKGPIDAVTGGRIIQPIPTIYYFSNLNFIAPRVFPFLTLPAAAYDPGYSYEQGELSIDSGQLREFQKKGNPDDLFYPVPGTGFAGEADRMLVPESFTFRFPDTAGLTSADFILRDAANNEINRQTLTGAASLAGGVKLNYSGKVVSPVITNANPADALYRLEVRGNNGYQLNSTLLFDPQLAGARPWAVIHLKTAISNPLFSLLDPNGFITTRKTSAGVTIPAPLFEIPVKSRLVFFRYVHNRGEKLEISPPMQNYLAEDGNALITLTPSRLTRSFFKIRKENDVTMQYAPNPVSYDIKKKPDGLFYCDLTVNHSKFFES